jgi:hypothetical protein
MSVLSPAGKMMHQKNAIRHLANCPLIIELLEVSNFSRGKCWPQGPLVVMWSISVFTSTSTTWWKQSHAYLRRLVIMVINLSLCSINSCISSSLYISLFPCETSALVEYKYLLPKISLDLPGTSTETFKFHAKFNCVVNFLSWQTYELWCILCTFVWGVTRDDLWLVIGDNINYCWFIVYLTCTCVK